MLSRHFASLRAPLFAGGEYQALLQEQECSLDTAMSTSFIPSVRTLTFVLSTVCGSCSPGTRP